MKARSVSNCRRRMPDVQRLAEEHVGLVKIIAAAICSKLPSYVELDELIQAGSLGLLDAAGKYDAAKGVPFEMYAKYRIRGAILDSLREVDCVSRDTRNHQKEIERVTQELAGKLRRMPTDDEVAAAMGVSAGRFAKLKVQVNAGSTRRDGVVTVETVNHEPADDPWHQPDNVCARAKLRELIDAAMRSLPERSRAIVQLYYRGDLTMREIGSRLGVNESRISQLHKRALEILGRTLRAMGIQSSAVC